ncbi:hypothetical protein B0A54_08092 [Friedmanniomyces endolithicus]|uniref:LSM12 anticodon-binding domain-containing protein n=1 Tax=Friedmanniomyces endolithicus TaxID=329885 RepID=A0A4U0UYJ1_9PEZI|nr:hypothetical protein B0A54_08092 [Friedmanniomyces endolithicus]
MADSKRNDAAGKVAMPKTRLGVLTFFRSIKVTTTAPDSNTYEGSLYTADPISNLLVLNIRAAATKTAAELASQPGDYRVMPISRLQSFQIVSLASGSANPTTAIPKLSEVDMKRLEKRCEDRVAALKEEVRSRGKGVTREGQAIFDALKRMYALEGERKKLQEKERKMPVPGGPRKGG